MDDGVLIGRAQLDYHLTPKDNHHLMFTGGILEDMFSGVGIEYLYSKEGRKYISKLKNQSIFLEIVFVLMVQFYSQYTKGFEWINEMNFYHSNHKTMIDIFYALAQNSLY